MVFFERLQALYEPTFIALLHIFPMKALQDGSTASGNSACNPEGPNQI